VRFVVEDSIFPIVWVEPGAADAPSVIRMTTQFRLLLSYLTESGLITTRRPRFQDCNAAYRVYLFNLFAENSERTTKGLSFRDIDAPEVFATESTGSCKSFTKQFPLAENQRPIRDNIVGLSLMFFYFHELGHIAKEHANPLRLTASTEEARQKQFLAYLRRSQQQEAEADAWAVDQIVEMNTQPNGLYFVSAFELMTVWSGIDCRTESFSTHPWWASRISAILSRVDVSYRRKHGEELPPQIKQLIAANKTFEREVRARFQCSQ
jgi:hypothetical protein